MADDALSLNPPLRPGDIIIIIIIIKGIYLAQVRKGHKCDNWLVLGTSSPTTGRKLV